MPGLYRDEVRQQNLNCHLRFTPQADLKDNLLKRLVSPHDTDHETHGLPHTIIRQKRTTIGPLQHRLRLYPSGRCLPENIATAVM